MRKVYEKPMIMFESFALSTSIAGDCERLVNAPSANNCGLNFGAYVVFLDSMVGICKGDEGIIDTIGGQDEYDGFCYHTFTGTTEGNFFNS